MDVACDGWRTRQRNAITRVSSDFDRSPSHRLCHDIVFVTQIMSHRGLTTQSHSSAQPSVNSDPLNLVGVRFFRRQQLSLLAHESDTSSQTHRRSYRTSGEAGGLLGEVREPRAVATPRCTVFCVVIWAAEPDSRCGRRARAAEPGALPPRCHGRLLRLSIRPPSLPALSEQIRHPSRSKECLLL